MSHYALTASKPKNAGNNQLTFHATMPVSQFIENNYADANGVDIVINPNGNKHPKGLFISWKDKNGTAFSGAVSPKIESKADLKEPVLSIVSAPGNDEEYFVILHNAAERKDDNLFANLK